MSASTPGPWFAREQISKDHKSLGWVINWSNGRIGWSSFATAGAFEGETAPYPVSAANARLIAAAPALKAALEGLLSAFESAPGLVNTNAAAFQKARAALRQAEGE